jgi:hypothetical protein
MARSPWHLTTTTMQYGAQPNPLACGLLVLASWLTLAAGAARSDEPPTKKPKIDDTTLRHKVLCGYQGWFRCPGDPADEGWKHWSRNVKKIAADTVTFEMWPDLTEFDAEEKYPASGFTHPDGKPAYLFSSVHPKTVRRHFRWMEQYGIDGVFVQRFVVDIAHPSCDRVLKLVRDSAAATGRVYAVCYDMTDAPADRLHDLLVSDWKRQVDEQHITLDDRYLHHGGKPVVFIWGFYPDRFDSALAHRIIDFFKTERKYHATLVGGCPWDWRAEKDREWARAFRRFDVISPWNVGNVMKVKGQKHAATGSWKEDLAEARKCGMDYLPVAYPGFGWTNLKGKDAAKATIPRLGGEFYWRQFVTAADLGVEMVYVAMFDEVDEATAIFKVSNNPPTQARFETFDGLPSDWYLRLTGEGSKVIRRERKSLMTLPIKR